jgi:hypothetical protein
MGCGATDQGRKAKPHPMRQIPPSCGGSSLRPSLPGGSHEGCTEWLFVPAYLGSIQVLSLTRLGVLTPRGSYYTELLVPMFLVLQVTTLLALASPFYRSCGVAVCPYSESVLVFHGSRSGFGFASGVVMIVNVHDQHPPHGPGVPDELRML